MSARKGHNLDARTAKGLARIAELGTNMGSENFAEVSLAECGQIASKLLEIESDRVVARGGKRQGIDARLETGLKFISYEARNKTAGCPSANRSLAICEGIARDLMDQEHGVWNWAVTPPLYWAPNPETEPRRRSKKGLRPIFG